MEVWLLYAFICVMIYGGLLTGFHLLMEYQDKKAELRAKWERFELWKEKEVSNQNGTHYHSV